MAATQSGAMPLSDEDARRQLRRAVIASTIGTTIEWYDFFLYSTVTGLVFAKLYFPESAPLVGTLQAFLIPDTDMYLTCPVVYKKNLIRTMCW